MVYTVYAGDALIHHSQSPNPEIKLVNPKVTLEDTAAGSFSCVIPPSNVGYDLVQRLTTIIYVYRDEKLIFEGRVIDERSDFYGNRQITCEGALAYLNDTCQPPAEYHNMTVRGFLEALLTVHNAKAGVGKVFRLGAVTVTDPNDSLYRYTNFESTLECIQDKLVDRLGGHLIVRYENGAKYIDYLEESLNTNSQTIEFGKNLLDFSKSWDINDFATVVIPQGERLEESPIEALDAYLDVKSVNGGSIYVYNQETVDTYGWIETIVRWDDVTTASRLLTKAQAYLSDIQFEEMSLEVNAVDLSYLASDSYTGFTIIFDKKSSADPDHEYLYVYYPNPDGGWNYVIRSGTNPWAPITVPIYQNQNGDIIFYWHSDRSVETWGFKIDRVDKYRGNTFTTPGGTVYNLPEYGVFSIPFNELDTIESRNEYSTYYNIMWSSTWNLNVKITAESFELFDKVHCISKPHGMDKFFTVTKVDIPLDNPMNSTFTFGDNKERNSLSASLKSENAKIKAQIDAMPSTTSVLDEAKDNADQIMRQLSNGYITTVISGTGENAHSESLIISDTQDYTQATRYWIWNINGLAYYAIPAGGSSVQNLGLAITMDGAINADKITTGHLIADRISGGTLTDLRGNTTWNLNNGTLSSNNFELITPYVELRSDTGILVYDTENGQPTDDFVQITHGSIEFSGGQSIQQYDDGSIDVTGGLGSGGTSAALSLNSEDQEVGLYNGSGVQLNMGDDEMVLDAEGTTVSIYGDGEILFNSPSGTIVFGGDIDRFVINGNDGQDDTIRVVSDITSIHVNHSGNLEIDFVGYNLHFTKGIYTGSDSWSDSISE